MRVLIGCEFSGRVREAFRRRGHEAYSCDLLPAKDASPFHIQGDVLAQLRAGWDMAIFHPPCTYLAGSGIHWNKRVPGRAAETARALEFVRQLLAAPIDRIALENPVGIVSTQVRRPDQIIQPYQFGADASKATCLWLKNLPLLVPTCYVPGRVVQEGPHAGRVRWSNQTDSGQNRLPPSDDRWALRSVTYEGIAEAMAQQWGGAVEIQGELL